MAGRALTLLAAAGPAGVIARPPFAVIRALAAVRRDIVFSVPVAQQVVALTFDDGPDERLTPRLLDVLATHGARATFFVLGSRAHRAPALLRQITDGGHELGNHLWADRRSAGQPMAEFEDDLVRTAGVLGATRLMRPGGGWIGRRKVALAARYGPRCVLGSLYPYDAQVGLRPRTVGDLCRRARPGAIIVLHEGQPARAAVVAATHALLAGLGRRGFAVVSVSELLALAAEQPHSVSPGTPVRRSAGSRGRCRDRGWSGRA